MADTGKNKVTLKKTGTLTPEETPMNQSSNSIDTIPTSTIHGNRRKRD